ncbi:uncharacterized protein LOC135948296 [Cloeon dipterum]
MRQEIYEELKKEEDLVFSGDARFDSPGFSAKYSLYSIMSNKDSKIVDFVLFQKGFEDGEMESKSFNHTFKRVVEEIGSKKIKTFCSDRNRSVAKLMREQFKGIEHSFDVWHLAKSLRKSLSKTAKTHKCLEPWLDSIIKHLWYCSSTCGGSADVLLEKWDSLNHHLRGEHEWQKEGKALSCEHPNYDHERQQNTDWVTDDDALLALRKVTHKPSFLRDLTHCRFYVHTGQLESFHNEILVYAPKRLHYMFENMQLRMILAILDHNNNVGRAVTGSHTRYSKSRKAFSLENTYETKDHTWRYDLIHDILQYAGHPDEFLGSEEEQLKLLSPPYSIPKSTVSVPKPGLEELQSNQNLRRLAAERQLAMNL